MVKEQSKKEAKSSTFYINVILHSIFYNLFSVTYLWKDPQSSPGVP